MCEHNKKGKCAFAYFFDWICFNDEFLKSEIVQILEDWSIQYSF